MDPMAQHGADISPHTLAVALGSISAVQETKWTVAHLFDVIFAQSAAVLI